MKRGDKYTLNNAELEAVDNLVAGKLEHGFVFPVPADRVRDSYRAEWAFCMIANVAPKFSYSADDGIDCYVTGVAFDVKQYPRFGDLVASKECAEKYAQAFALMCGSGRDFVFSGWLWRDELIVPERLKDWFNQGEDRKCYRAKADELRTVLALEAPRDCRMGVM